MNRFTKATFSRWARPLLGYLAIVLAMTLFGSTLVRPTALANTKNSPQIDPQPQLAPEAPQTAFPADAPSLGAIPDGPGTPTTCGAFGTPRNITFTVTGVASPLTDVSVSMTGTHSWIGDLEATLIAPDGVTTATLFKNVGAATATACGSSSDFTGPYNISDTAPASPTLWTAAASTPVPAASYRASVALTGANTALTSVFAGIPSANGTWTLRIRDGGAGDTGSITAATLNLTGATACTSAKRPLDFDGDGKTDATVKRNTGGGASGQNTWYIKPSGGGSDITFPWGIQTDFFLNGDYDGDGKSDVVVWRGDIPGNSYWYILRSSNNTLLAVNFGQNGDDPRVTSDYDGDGKTDPAVYRAGAASGDKSTWYWLGSVDGLQHGYQFGQNGDFPAPGDYDGDNKADFVVQRNGGGGGAVFYLHQTTGGDTAIWFGTPTDVIVPGYYDADCRTDIATLRGDGSGGIAWYVRNSTNGSTTAYLFGRSATDFPTQGDWDGDGKTDVGVWRPNADPTLNFFYWVRSIDGALGSIEWGQNGDYPVANFNSH